MYKGKSIAIIIPARYGSTRLPGKPLADILGKPMIQLVFEIGKRSKLADQVIIATDDSRIYQAAKNFGAEAWLTKKNHPSGNNRVAEVAQKIKEQIIVNLQGDEPLMKPEIIDTGIRLIVDKKALVATPMTFLKPHEYNDESVVKVIKNKKNIALDFFRKKPMRDHFAKKNFKYYHHLGLFIFRRDFLFKYMGWQPTPVEIKAQIDQLRILDHGYPINLYLTKYSFPSVNTKSDLLLIRRILKKLKTD
ncbi:MAG TPA: 3-deoxy-manno-octulosonate cytidylyltransferase [Patescibacteria group bacterium]|nr:3-deoxy-manno-octulosonate cytidylyltransferase [Patescibacteria group bacterium]